jgi:glycerol-3-phosphate dehydrogenase
MYDIAIIGAGVIGCSIARELSRYQLKIILLDKENDVGAGTTKANSAIVHAGYDAPYQTKKAFFNVRGNSLFETVCQELSVSFNRIGSLVCALNEEEKKTLNELLENGKKLNIPGLKIINNKEEIRSLEPNINDQVIAALYAPTAGITDPFELTVAYAENAIENGAELQLNFTVKAISQLNNHFKIVSEEKTIESKYIINCAGVYADQIYNMITDQTEFTIRPRRGQYYLLDKTAKECVSRILFPCPSKLGKGVLVLPTVDQNVLIGPDSEDLDFDHKEATETTVKGLTFIKERANQLVRHVPLNETITTFSGLRAEPSTNDFIIGESKIPRFINAAGMKSPGLSSAPAIAVYIADLVNNLLKSPPKNKNFNPLRRPRVRFEKLNDQEKASIILKNPAYGRVICRCETITEGEIIDTVKRKAGATTINGIKRRVRAGAGRCQGGFCGPRIVEILARELNQDITKILLEGPGSQLIIGPTKDNHHKEDIHAGL